MFIIKNKVLLFMILAGSIHTSLLGQLPGAVSTEINKAMPKPVPTSPNTAALGKFGSYDVSLYTGLPQISVPLFEVKSGNLTLPITLSYHASGIRMLENASWVGLGWSLLAGGQISRETRGLPDEEGYWRDPLIETPGICGPGANWQYLYRAENGSYDTQPDVFSYSFPGKNGNFMLGKKGEAPFLYPYEPFKVTHNGINSTGSFTLNNFTITDAQGTTYRYGESVTGEPAKETTTVDRNPFTPLSATTAWLLNQIKSANSDNEIRFNYQQLGWATIAEPRTTITVLDNCIGANCPPHGPDLIDLGTSRSTVSQLGLNEIVFAGGKVRFIAGAKRLDQINLAPLDRIEIYSEVAGVYSLIRTITFHYSYFGYHNAPSTPVKLRLDKIRFIGSDGNVDNTYAFSYHTDNFSWNEGNQYSKDFWGFYNGKQNGDLIPSQQIQYTENNSIIQRTVTIGSADRSTVGTFMKEGVLKQITFPTGGYTQFDYEPHRYSEDNTTKLAAGLRVTSIRSYDGSGAPPVTKTYVYGVGGTGIGVKNFFNSLLYFKSESAIHNLCCIRESCANTTYRQRTFFGNSLIETGSAEGSPVVYPVVSEIYGDATSNIGKIIYEYDNGSYTPDSLQIILGPQSSKNFAINYSWRRGNLTRRAVYTKTNQIISEALVSYTLMRRTKKLVGTAIERQRTYTNEYPCIGDCTNEIGEPVVQNEFRWTPYYQTSGALRLTSSTEKTYDNTNSARAVSTSKGIVYDAQYLLPIQETQTATDPEVVVLSSIYPFSYTFTGPQTGSARAMQMLFEKNIISAPVEEYTIRRNNDGSSARVTAAQLTIYKVDPDNVANVMPDSVLFLETANPIPVNQFAPSSIVNANRVRHSPAYRNGIKYLSTDGRGNIAEIRKEQDYTTSYLWAYRNRLPIAEVSNTGLDLLPDSFIDLSYETGASFSTNVFKPLTLSPSFTIGHQQLVHLSVHFYNYNGTPTAAPVLDLVLKKSDGTIAFDPSPVNAGMYNSSFVLSPGTYNFSYTGSANSAVGNPSTSRFTITLSYQSKSSRNSKVFHSSFEETGIAISGAKTGTRVNPGAYTLQLPTSDGKYWITWWQKSSGDWVEQKALVTIPYIVGGVRQQTYTIGAGSTYVDEVRLYPQNAFMNTYTYDPVLGLTSVTDRNNNTTYYSYDGMGRLKSVKDRLGKIVSNHLYHYKQ